MNGRTTPNIISQNFTTMKSLRKNIHVDEVAFEQSTNRDKSLINILALFTPVSAFIAGFAVYYSINYLTEAWFIAMIFGGLAGIAFYYHDTTLLGEFKKGVIYARILVSAFLIFVLMVPVKIDIIGEEKIIQEITQITTEHNNLIENDFLKAKASIESKEEELQRKVTAAGGEFDRTKKAQKLVEARRERDAFIAKKEALIEEQRIHFDAMKVEPRTTKTDIASYYFQNMFNSDNPSETFINLFILVMALLFETMPVFIRVGLNGGTYMELKEDSEAFAAKTRKNKREIKSKLLTEDGLEDITELLEEYGAWSELEKGAKTDFSDPEQLKKMVNMVQEIKARKKAEEEPPIEKKDLSQQNGKPKDKEEDYTDFDYES